MSDNELLRAISDMMDEKLKTELQPLKDDMQTLKEEMREVKKDVQTLKDEMQEVKARVTNIELTLENETNHNIQLLAENHITLVNRLNEAIHVQDKSILYEVQVSGLKARLDVLEREIKEIKTKIAS